MAALPVAALPVRGDGLASARAGKAGRPMVATISVTVVVTSASAPRTSPVMPPSLRTACRSSPHAATSPAATASGRVQPRGSPVIVAEITTAATAAASVTSVIATGIAGRTVPATNAPSPSRLAAGTPWRHAQVIASRPATTAAINAAGPRPWPADSA